MVYVYTCILGGFDNLRPPLVPKTPEVRYLCFTDNPLLPDCPPWEFRPAHLLNAQPPDSYQYLGEIDLARSSRVPKILPHLILPEDCEVSIWHDGNFQLQVDPMEIISRELRFDDWAAHKHPARDCVYDEGQVLLSEKIGSAQDTQLQMDEYRRQGFPAHAGLWANGFIVRRHTTSVAALNERWWAEYAAGCARDQMAFPYALAKTPLTINTLQWDIFQSPYIHHGWHGAWKNKPDNVARRMERERVYHRTSELARVAGAGGYGFADFK